MVRRPLSILGPRPEMLPAICRYAEAKQLFGGVTTTQGIRLASAAGISTYFRGFVRNVELPDDGALPRGESRMPDVAAKDVEKFFKTIETYEKRGAAYLERVRQFGYRFPQLSPQISCPV
jgi:5-methylthioadenosine/S-adenosylhomocysteine deaminase